MHVLIERVTIKPQVPEELVGLEQKAAIAVVNQYLSGEPCNRGEVEQKISDFPVSFNTYIKNHYGDYSNFLTNILPNDTRTRKCKKCGGLIQVSNKDTRSIYCLGCKQELSFQIVSQRIDHGETVTFRKMMSDPGLKWIVTQCSSIWGKGYREFIKDEFETAQRQVLDAVRAAMR